MIREIDGILAGVESQVREILKAESVTGRIHFHVYGKDGVMGALEPEKRVRSHELGIVIEAVGATQEDADAVCSLTRSTLLHYGYPGRISTAGQPGLPLLPLRRQNGRGLRVLALPPDARRPAGASSRSGPSGFRGGKEST